MARKATEACKRRRNDGHAEMGFACRACARMARMTMAVIGNTQDFRLETRCQ
jgi:hypothetical protein